jgi:hypothetical protein
MADDRTYESHRTGVDAELVALGVGHRHVGVDPVQLHGPAVDEPGDLCLEIVAAQIQVRRFLCRFGSGTRMNK